MPLKADRSRITQLSQTDARKQADSARYRGVWNSNAKPQIIGDGTHTVILVYSEYSSLLERDLFLNTCINFRTVELKIGLYQLTYFA